jgi:hypothetical protein
VFRKCTNTPKMRRITKGNTTDSMRLGSFYALIHCLDANHPAKSQIAIKTQNCAAIASKQRIIFRVYEIAHHGFDIVGDHADAMGVMSFQICDYQVLGDGLCSRQLGAGLVQYRSSDLCERFLINAHPSFLWIFFGIGLIIRAQNGIC